MKQSIIKVMATVVIGATLFSGCATTGGAGRVDSDSNVKYGDAKAVETVTADFGSSDLQATAEMMTQSLLETRYIARSQQPPKVRLREVKNLTYEHIDTKSITDKIKIKLLKSGSVRFLADKSNLDQVNNERDFTETATKKTALKAMTDSDYIIAGRVTSIKKANSNVQDVYYNITLELLDPQSGEILWADEKEIRKVTKKSSLGW